MTLPVPQGIGVGSETSCAWPAGHQAGDWGFLFVEHGGAVVATPTGWTIIPGFPIDQGGGSIMSGFMRKATSSSEGNAALAGGSNHMWGVIVTARGADPTTPVHAVATQKQLGATTTGSAPGLQTTVADCLVFHIVAWSLDSAGPNASAWANASLANVAEQYDAGTITGDGGGLTIATGEKAAAGALGLGSVTLTSTAFTAATMAIQPPAATPAQIVVTNCTLQTTDTGVTITFTDATGDAQYNVDGGAFAPAASPLTISGLALGPHTVILRSTASPSVAEQVIFTVIAPSVGGSPPVVTNNVTTEDLIRDRIIELIKAIVPTYLAGERFDPWRDDADADFRKAAKANPNNAWRRFQVRDDGTARPPEVASVDVRICYVTFEIAVAYDQSSRAGNAAARDRDKLIKSDEHLIQRAIGLEGYANFIGASAPNATFFGDDVHREREDGVDFLVLRVTYRFFRSLAA